MINCWIKSLVNFAFGFAAASVLFLFAPSRDKSEEDVETLEEELKALDRLEKLEKELEKELKSLEKELDNMGRLAEKEQIK